MMADDDVYAADYDADESKVVTKSLFSTCRLQQPSEYRVDAAAW